MEHHVPLSADIKVTLAGRILNETSVAFANDSPNSSIQPIHFQTKKGL